MLRVDGDTPDRLGASERRSETRLSSMRTRRTRWRSCYQISCSVKRSDATEALESGFNLRRTVLNRNRTLRAEQLSLCGWEAGLLSLQCFFLDVLDMLTFLSCSWPPTPSTWRCHCDHFRTACHSVGWGNQPSLPPPSPLYPVRIEEKSIQTQQISV